MEISYFAIIIGAIFVNNVVLAQFLGICPFLGVSSKVETSMGMGAAVTFVMALTALVAWPIQTYILVPLHIEYMQTIVFILVIAALVQMVEIILKKGFPVALSGARYFPPSDHDQLRRAGCGDPHDPEGVQPAAECNLLGVDGPRIRPRADPLRRYPRTPRLRGCPQGFQRVFPSHWSRPVFWPWLSWDSPVLYSFRPEARRMTPVRCGSVRMPLCSRRAVRTESL